MFYRFYAVLWTEPLPLDLYRLVVEAPNYLPLACSHKLRCFSRTRRDSIAVTLGVPMPSALTVSVTRDDLDQILGHLIARKFQFYPIPPTDPRRPLTYGFKLTSASAGVLNLASDLGVYR